MPLHGRGIVTSARPGYDLSRSAWLGYHSCIALDPLAAIRRSPAVLMSDFSSRNAVRSRDIFISRVEDILVESILTSSPRLDWLMTFPLQSSTTRASARFWQLASNRLYRGCSEIYLDAGGAVSESVDYPPQPAAREGAQPVAALRKSVQLTDFQDFFVCPCGLSNVTCTRPCLYHFFGDRETSRCMCVSCVCGGLRCSWTVLEGFIRKWECIR